MLEQLSVLPPDPILGLAAACRADPNPDKIDLTVGVYMDEDGICPVFEAVKQAQAALVAEEVTKAYLPAAGDMAYLTGMKTLVFGDDLAGDGSHITAVQTPGGCGALRIASEVLAAASPDATVWISNPTWPVHIPLMGSVGLKFATYSYYDPASHGVDFSGMVDDLKAAKPGDVVLLHGCCHNPSGADLTLEQWSVIADMAIAQGFTVLVDLAYQGMGQGLAEDVAGLRLLATRLGELIVAASCSKNLGLYRERTGVALFYGKDTQTAAATRAMVWVRLVVSTHATCARRLARWARIKHARTARVVGSGAQSNLPPHDLIADTVVRQTVGEDRSGFLLHCQGKRHVLVPRLIG